MFSVSEYFSEYDFMVIHIAKKASTHGGAQKKESAPVERGFDSPWRRLGCIFKIPNYNLDEFVKSQNFDFFHCNPRKLKDLKYYFCAFCTFLRSYQSSMTKTMESPLRMKSLRGERWSIMF